MSRRKTSNNGILFVVSSPSGAGKTTVVAHLLKQDKRLRKTVSHTTRLPRPGEKRGKDYFFTAIPAFRRMIRQGDFLEWTRAYGNYYGTSVKTIGSILKKGLDAVLVIEANGGKAIRRKFGKRGVFVRLLPPSLAELKKRIKARSGMPASQIQRRLKEAESEIRAMNWYDYTITNDRLHRAVTELRAVVEAERCKTVREGRARHP